LFTGLHIGEFGVFGPGRITDCTTESLPFGFIKNGNGTPPIISLARENAMG